MRSQGGFSGTGQASEPDDPGFLIKQSIAVRFGDFRFEWK